MDPRKVFVDERLVGRCAYCGGAFNTRDHVPSKVFLDEPFPENLPVVDACLDCNNSISSDEQYLACLLDCVIAGSSEPGSNHREKVRRTLEQRPAIRSLIEAARSDRPDGEILWTPDHLRVRKVVVKLARGHVAYEYSEAHPEEPEFLSIAPIPRMSDAQIHEFENVPVQRAWPEIGSRAFMRAVVACGNIELDDGWQVVQKSRYRYLVSGTPGLSVKLVLSEYLACEVGW